MQKERKKQAKYPFGVMKKERKKMKSRNQNSPKAFGELINNPNQCQKMELWSRFLALVRVSYILNLLKSDGKSRCNVFLLVLLAKKNYNMIFHHFSRGIGNNQSWKFTDVSSIKYLQICKWTRRIQPLCQFKSDIILHF